jgi:hypothetical protein
LISLSRLTRSLRASLLMSLTLIFATYSVALGAAVGTRNQYRQAFSAVMPGPAAAVVNLGPNHRLPQGIAGYAMSSREHLIWIQRRNALQRVDRAQGSCHAKLPTPRRLMPPAIEISQSLRSPSRT